jgi:hypothetical protein
MTKRIIPASQEKRFSVVAKAGGDYTTITAALAYAATKAPKASDQWVIYVYPGRYTESVICEDCVHINGVGAPGAVIIDGLVVGAKCRLENLTFDRTTGSGALVTYAGSSATIPFELVECRAASTQDSRAILSLSNSGLIELTRCQFKGEYRVIEQAAGIIIATDCVFEEDADNGTAYPVYVSGGDKFEYRNCLLIGGGTQGICVFLVASVATARFLHCTFRKGSAGTVTLDSDTARTVAIAGCLATHAASGDFSPTDLVVDAGV